MYYIWTAKRYQVFGHVSYSAPPQIYQFHNFFHDPEDEPFGVSIIESSSAGLHVVANEQGGAAEEFARWSTGMVIYLNNNTDALYSFLNNFMAYQPVDNALVTAQVYKGFSCEVLAERLQTGLRF